jgi:hypothetical protein
VINPRSRPKLSVPTKKDNVLTSVAAVLMSPSTVVPGTLYKFPNACTTPASKGLPLATAYRAAPTTIRGTPTAK